MVNVLSPHWIVGFLLALSSMSGRWGFARVWNVPESVAGFAEPRYIFAALAVLVLVASGVGRRGPGYIEREGSTRPLRISTHLVFFLYLLGSSVWSPISDFTYSKFFEVALLMVLNLSLWISLERRSRDTIGGFWWGVLVALLPLFLGGIVSELVSGGGGHRLSVFGGGPNAFARNCGILAFALLFFYQSRGGMRHLLLASTVIPVVLLSGSRGGLLAVMVATVVFFWVVVRTRGLARSPLVPAAFWGLSVLGLAWAVAPGSVLQRFEKRFVSVSFGGGGDVSLGGVDIYTSGRGTLFELAVRLGMDEPVLGGGLGSFMYYSGGSYPHNLFLEAFAEGGVVGLFLLCLTLVPVMRVFWSGRRGPDAAAVGVVVLCVVSSMFSGDVFDSRNIWLFLLIDQFAGGVYLSVNGENRVEL